MRCMCGSAKLRAETNQPQLLPGLWGRPRWAGRWAGVWAGRWADEHSGGSWHMEHGVPTAAGLGPSPLITRPYGRPTLVLYTFVTGNILRFKGTRNRTFSGLFGLFGS